MGTFNYSTKDQLAKYADALTSKRPYKDAFPIAKALDIIEKERGQHFDPSVADAFLDHIDEFLKIKSRVDAGGDMSLPGL